MPPCGGQKCVSNLPVVAMAGIKLGDSVMGGSKIRLRWMKILYIYLDEEDFHSKKQRDKKTLQQDRKTKLDISQNVYNNQTHKYKSQQPI
jgi:hypothetical protein